MTTIESCAAGKIAVLAIEAGSSLCLAAKKFSRRPTAKPADRGVEVGCMNTTQRRRDSPPYHMTPVGPSGVLSVSVTRSA